MIKNMGYTFFHFFHQPEIADKQKKKCADFIADKLSPSKVTEFFKLYKEARRKKQNSRGISLDQSEHFLILQEEKMLWLVESFPENFGFTHQFIILVSF